MGRSRFSISWRHLRHSSDKLLGMGAGITVVSAMVIASSGLASAATPAASWAPVIFENSLGDCMNAGSGGRLTPIVTEPLSDCSTFEERPVSGGIEVAYGAYDIGESGGEIKLETPSASTVLVVGTAWSIGGHVYNNLSIINTSDYLGYSAYGQPLRILSDPGAMNSWRWPRS